MRFGHPSTRRLQSWLNGEDDSLDSHLATCERCAEKIESLADADSSLLQPLLTLLEPPDELPDRLRGSIDQRMRAREDLALISELFGLPIRAARVMTNTNQGDT